MKKKEPLRILISKEVRSHMASHFCKELPGSKFYCNSPEELLDKAKKKFPEKFNEAEPDEDGRIRISLTFPEEIGVSNVVHISELTDEEQKRIKIINRQGFLVKVVETNRIIPTHECQIILSSEWHLITMFPGELAPPLSHYFDIQNGYWGNHVFII